VKKGRKLSMKKYLVVLNIIALLGFAGGSAYLYLENRDLNKQLNMTEEQIRDELIAEINKVFELPDENPEIVIVNDPVKFKAENSTFDNVEIGDHLLVFRKARLGVLYRQSEKRVVKTTNVVIPISIELVGSQQAVDNVEKKLAEFGSQVTISKTFKDDITQSFIYDVDANQETEVSSIAKELGYDVASSLPSSVIPASQTEILIIVADEQPVGQP
jgi:hypothetical protein